MPHHQTTSHASTKACLLEAARHGDQAAWHRLVERHTGLLWAIARAHRLDRSDAADVVQTSWLRLIEHLPDIKKADSVGAWLATTARRECLRTLRQAARAQPSDAMDDMFAADIAEIDARLVRDERDVCLRQAFARLPASDQALLRLLMLDPAPSYREISAALGMPIGSIGPTRGRALERLRNELETVEAGIARDGRQ